MGAMISGVLRSFSALVKILCHFLKEQIKDSGQTGGSACRAQPVHAALTIFSCIIWFVLSTELGTADQTGRGWGRQRQGEPSWTQWLVRMAQVKGEEEMAFRSAQGKFRLDIFKKFKNY